MKSLMRTGHRAWTLLERALFFFLIVTILGNGTVQNNTLHSRVITLARADLFDYATWEFDALWVKTKQELFGPQFYLDDSKGKALVLAYLDTLAQVQTLEVRIGRIYADPTISDPAAAAADLRIQRDVLRHKLAHDQPLVESIIEGQVSAVLADEGFGLWGQPLPPVSMHFSEIPDILIISPRDRIELIDSLDLVHVPVEEREILENQIDSELNVSSLIEPLGGLSLYPSMILETADPMDVFEITAHEWVHHYLLFFPLGLEYETRPETRIINETVATFFGRVIAQKVLARYYPELISPPALATGTPSSSGQPPLFDFAQEMNTTRITVDSLLAQGRIEEAEDYMESQRRKFVANGYSIRKLNQAYFAFYGGYQGEAGAGGADPIGPAVQELLELSPNVRSWLETLRGITTREELLAALDRARAQP